MSGNEQTNDTLNQVLELLGVPQEAIEKLTKEALPGARAYAQGGKGDAVNITYVDNYSTLLLVYTFLLHSAERSDSKDESNSLNKSLLSTLKAAMKEQQEFRKAFLAAVNSLRNK